MIQHLVYMVLILVSYEKAAGRASPTGPIRANRLFCVVFERLW